MNKGKQFLTTEFQQTNIEGMIEQISFVEYPVNGCLRPESPKDSFRF